MEDKAAWVITGMEDTSHFTPGQAPQRAKRVNFRLADGTHSYVVIPDSDFEPEKVYDIVEEHARKMIHVLGMEGQPVSTLMQNPNYVHAE